ncbi:creatininase family protein [Neoroseomonas lacus]|uniref:Creatininase n=1 Tax=Neoroseomonas lacus TaxID=287609 RepID=A0A917NWV6_9PROT|nr:creatininase family protein [Neoroseomonas lacus]GGJ32852.1 creatininase [Neoroseomonas lacus]
MAEHRWERLTAPELRALAARDAVVIVPVAALEQHGPHLPVWTDSFIGHAVSVRAAELCADLPAVVLPPMWLGMSEHHFPFGGTISLDYATFAAVLRGIVKSLLADGFSRVMLFNSHGGNIDALAVSARELAHEFGIPVLTTTITKVAPGEITAALTAQTGIQHACEGETSLWLHLDPAQVRMEEIANTVSSDAPAGNPVSSRFWSFSERAPVTGVRGDPRAATAEKGKAIFEGMAAGLAKELRNAANWTVPDDVWRRGRAQGPR